ncbi:MAG TPA: cation diffusion facilitator family transporter [Anaerolineales bacterium]|nr:cation diffusion facilitator family transporter [Anaerolineales bacterium]
MSIPDHSHENHSPEHDPHGSHPHGSGSRTFALTSYRPHDHRAHAHQHTHGAVDPSLFRSQRGIWAVKWSLVGLLVTALLQAIIVVFTGSVALLADTIHNFGDGLTAIPLWIAFKLGERRPTRRFTYGYGRMEDLAGVAIVLMILVSALLAGYESFNRLFQLREVRFLWAVIAAALLGFAGNEAVALFRIKVGKEIGSASLVADGYHARADALASLAVLAGAIGVSLGYPLADPIAGLVITLVILRILWEAGRSVFRRLLDGVDPEVVEEITFGVRQVPGVVAVTMARVRWLGHRMLAELEITVEGDMSVSEGHAVAQQVHHQLTHQLEYLSEITIHVDPADASGKDFHHTAEHVHDNFPLHSH